MPGAALKPRSAEKRRVVLAVAAEIFAERGFEKTSIKAVADEAHVSTSTIYTYFKDKADLLDQTVYGLIDEVVAKAVLEGQSGQDPFENLARAMRWVNRSFARNPLLSRIYTFQRHAVGHRIGEYVDYALERIDPLCMELLESLTPELPPGCDDAKTLNALMRLAMQGWLLGARFGAPPVPEERLTEGFLGLLKAASEGKPSPPEAGKQTG